MNATFPQKFPRLLTWFSGAGTAALLLLGSTAHGAQAMVAGGLPPDSVSVMPQPSVWAALTVGVVYIVFYRRWMGGNRLPKQRRAA
jgi:hypothetical protein